MYIGKLITNFENSKIFPIFTNDLPIFIIHFPIFTINFFLIRSYGELSFKKNEL